MADTFEEIICEILKKLDADFDNKEELKEKILIILKELINGNYSIVSKEDEADKYIEEYNREKIEEEIKRKIKKDEVILEEYVKYMINYINLYNINNSNISNINLEKMVEELSINNNLKEHLKRELARGNVNALHGYIGDNILDKYISNQNSEYSFRK